ncbi:sortase (surface protein transpeptidase) [Kibdelosporangium banguiense]|uniref:Sortase (Surface protein transpeptidase) n=1 Tax=Kibdelosporangium banguiense TaxID=1365924 RepID=A0ABS4TBN0_9PSEU|nr:class E sortase [Kibdelosporangium banguiense]MBP2321820.1 sortase (surface protein transpeptidase) [Kibdelosporangium banguiense]
MGSHEGDHRSGRLYGDLEEGPPQPGDKARNVVRNIGELLITAGLIVLLFVVYELYITDLFSAGKQREAEAALDNRWQPPASDTVEGGERTNKVELEDGKGFAKLYIPKFGADFHFTVLEGTSDKTLEAGPGHYKGTALPGDLGNFAVAGHRVGKGAPFNDLDLLESCDAIVVETQASWFVYRVLPMKDEVKSWPARKSGNQRCANVEPLPGPYTKTLGQEIVKPEQGGVISPIPYATGQKPEHALLTLTTCHPQFSDAQRLIVHAVLDRQWAKDPAKPGEPAPELQEND